MIKQFDTIYVTQPSHNYSALAKYCQQVKFVMMGTEKTLQEAYQACLDNLRAFNPATDAIVAVGKVNGVFLAGIVLAQLFPEGISFDMGIYISSANQISDSDYKWEQVHV